LNDNCVTGCAETEGVTAHSLTGTPSTFKEEGLGGEHKECFLLSVRSAVAAILELLDSKDQL
jgi:hypothetical protein